MTQRSIDFAELERKAVPELWTVDEIFDLADSNMIRRLVEDSRIERKPAGIHADSLATYVCMWANTPPSGGVIAIGIEDDGQITGCTNRTESLVDIERRIKNDLVRDATFVTKKIPATNVHGEPDYLLLFRVQFRENGLVEINSGEAYIRYVDTRHRLTDAEKHELRLERGQLSFELEPCNLKWPDEFNLKDANYWAECVRVMKKLADSPPLHQILVRHRLGKLDRGDFVPNNACALMFANDPQQVVPGCMIRFQRIEGDVTGTGENRNVVHDIQVTGTIPKMIDLAHDIVETHLRTYSRLGPGGRFYTAPEYPEQAWHEIIVNACAHRSYSLKGANIFIRMFDDKFVVDSPGGFAALVTPENIYEVHYRRNWWLMDALFYLDFVKCENEGTKRIRAAMANMNLPEPEFEQKQVGNAVVRVTLRHGDSVRETLIDSDISGIIAPNIAAKLNYFEKTVVKFIGEHGAINVSQAMKLLQRPRWHTARDRLDDMVTAGVLKRISRFERDPNNRFVLATDNTEDEP